jgi:hypothetical protein
VSITISDSILKHQEALLQISVTVLARSMYKGVSEEEFSKSSGSANDPNKMWVVGRATSLKKPGVYVGNWWGMQGNSSFSIASLYKIPGFPQADCLLPASRWFVL